MALLLTWDVDPAASYVRLAVPDQNVYVTNNNLGNVNVQMRDPNNTSAWTDAGGRYAAIDGTFTTAYADLSSITFLSGSNTLHALEQVSLRPNPADWDPVTLSYTNTTTAPVGFGARVRGTIVLIIFPITVDIAYFALRDVHFDVSSGLLPLTGGNIPTNQIQFGISSAISDVDGIEITGAGQPVPDLWREPMNSMVATNSLGGTIQNIGGRNRKVTVNISTPLTMDLQGTILHGTASGQVVAYATIPEPPPLRIAASANQAVTVAWPASVTGFLLEKNADLNTGGWTVVTNAPSTVGLEQQVTLPASGNRTFYRLRSQ